MSLVVPFCEALIRRQDVIGLFLRVRQHPRQRPRRSAVLLDKLYLLLWYACRPPRNVLSLALTQLQCSGHLVAEHPGVAILQQFPVAKILGANIILWGAVLLTTAACSSFAGLATVRFLLGMTEATISPGFVAVTGIG